MTQQRLYSWGHYPAEPQTAHSCFWRDDLPPLFDNLRQQFTTTLAYGNGRSYGDSCLAASQHVLHTRELNRFLAIDWHTGVLQAEAGVTLAEILQLAVPHGWFLPVTPGTQFVTLGGAIANDVHGKNHHIRGTFGAHVSKFCLLRSDQAAQICSPSENTGLFNATIGGLGLTGIISWVELQLMPIKSSQILSGSTRFNNLAEFFQLASIHDSQHEYTVAWIDCAARGKSAGRGIFMFGDHAQDGGLHVSNKTKFSVPLTSPVSLINPLSLQLFNQLYFHKHPTKQQQSSVPFEPFFYPLDSIYHWNRIYGKRGFQQYQCVIPEQQAERAINELLTRVAQQGSGSFLSVLKRCGNITSPGLLSFPIPGVSLALDFPHHPKLYAELFKQMDTIVREAGGRLYPAKDAHMSAEDFQLFYPQWTALEAQRDPALCSRFWQRVALKEV